MGNQRGRDRGGGGVVSAHPVERRLALAPWPIVTLGEAMPEDPGGAEYWDDVEAWEELLAGMADRMLDEGDYDSQEEDEHG